MSLCDFTLMRASHSLQGGNISRLVQMIVLCSLCLGCSAERDSLALALASSMAPVAERLAALYEKSSASDAGRIHPALASSGVLYVQISRGAPYGVAVFADEALSSSLAQQGSHRRYRCIADAPLGIWAPGLQPDDDVTQTLSREDIRILIPDPATAPAGLAASVLLPRLGLERREIIRIGSAAHTARLALRGAGDLAIVPVPLLLALERAGEMKGAWVRAPEDCCRLSYQAVLLQDSAAANALFEFLIGGEVAELLRDAGFEAPQDTQFCTPGGPVTSRFL